MPACYTQRCHQGRQPCPTPYACSGLKTTCGGETVCLPITMEEDEQRPSMFASRGFWIAGACCLAFWAICMLAIAHGFYTLIP